MIALSESQGVARMSEVMKKNRRGVMNVSLWR